MENSVTMMVVEVLVPISFFATILIAVYFVLKARTKERLALIEKGADVNMLVTSKPKDSPLKNGLLFMGIGFGLCLGFWSTKIFGLDGGLTSFVAIVAPALLFGGVGLVIYYILESKK